MSDRVVLSMLREFLFVWFILSLQRNPKVPELLGLRMPLIGFDRGRINPAAVWTMEPQVNLNPRSTKAPQFREAFRVRERRADKEPPFFAIADSFRTRC